MHNKLQKLCGTLFVFMLLGILLVLTPIKARALSGYSVMSISNSERAAIGVASLSYNTSLAQAAQMRAEDMINNNYWSHTSPSGQSMGYFLSAVGYPVYTAGENLSRGWDTDADVVSAWMSSSSHSATVLSPDYNEIGVGYASGPIDGDYTTIVVAYYASTGPINTPGPVAEEAPATETAQQNFEVESSQAPSMSIPDAQQTFVEADTPAVSQDIAVTAIVAEVVGTQPTVASTTSGAFAGSEVVPLQKVDNEQPGRSLWSSVTNLLQYFELFYIIKHASLII